MRNAGAPGLVGTLALAAMLPASLSSSTATASSATAAIEALPGGDAADPEAGRSGDDVPGGLGPSDRCRR